MIMRYTAASLLLEQGLNLHEVKDIPWAFPDLGEPVRHTYATVLRSSVEKRQGENVVAGIVIPINGTTIPVTTTNYTMGDTHTLTPNQVNDFRVGRNYLNTAALKTVRRRQQHGFQWR